jgi:hypothetical protein
LDARHVAEKGVEQSCLPRPDAAHDGQDLTLLHVQLWHTQAEVFVPCELELGLALHAGGIMSDGLLEVGMGGTA